MGEIGWAFIKGKAPGGSPGSVQYNDGETWITGSENFKYIQDSNTVVLSSSVFVSGTLYANDYHVNTINETVTNISSQGSTAFGNSVDDTHIFTGSATINGNFEVVGGSAYFSASAGSDLIFTSGSTFYSSSNNDVPADATFVRAENPAMVVSGAAVFNDGVSFQGGIYGASPIQIYAPLTFQDNGGGKSSTFEAGKISGDLSIHTTDIDSPFVITGPGGIAVETDTGTPLIRALKLAHTEIQDHPNMNGRNHAEFKSFLNQVQTKVPVFTGQDKNNMDHYTMESVVSSRMTSRTDIRRNSYMITFEVPHTEFDMEYENLEATNDAALQGQASDAPFLRENYDNLMDTISVMDVGTFPDVGAGNKYGVRRGIRLAGNIVPSAIDRDALGKAGTPYPNFGTKDLTIGHPAARWGDFFISNNRKINWGDNRNHADWCIDSEENNNVCLGFQAASNALEVEGARLKLCDNLEMNVGGYINFGLIQEEDGYGFRDHNGELQFKNQTGNWESFHDAFDSVGGGGALQLSNGAGGYIYSDKLTFSNDTLTVDGTIVANELIVNTIDQTVVNISMTGSTAFGDTADDTHSFIGSMSVSGSLTLNRKVVTDNYTILPTDHFIGVNSDTNITIQLPLASELKDGQFFTIKDENGGEEKEIILSCSGADQIDGNQSISLTSPYTAVNLYSNGQNKFFIF
tara:strand:+ start:6091 stop:8157 length:2067 start_codon:yes stop_codon:yes gene_type:complete